MDSTPMTVTSFAVLLLLVIFIIALICHFLRPSALTWIRSNKEEKIGLSKNKLFHANGYMIHSGSEFLLSTSGSFKRFDTIDKDFKQTGQHPAQRTSPLWNLPQTEQKIPPQPLRPAPAPTQPPPTSGNSAKSVKFSFTEDQTDHFRTDHLQTMETSLNEDFVESISMKQTNDRETSSQQTCKQSTIPQRIQAPPKTRLTNTTQAVLLASAIPRPTSKRLLISMQNGDYVEQTDYLGENHYAGSNANHETSHRNSSNSTNPFLCESVNTASAAQKKGSNSASLEMSHTDIISPHLPVSTATNITETPHASQTSNGNNPFYIEPINANIKNTTQANKLSEDPTKSFNGINASGCSNLKPQSEEESSMSTKSQSQNPLFRNRSFSETEASDPGLTNFSSTISSIGMKLTQKNNPFVGLTQKVKGPKMLQKTLSEDFLFRNIPGAVNPVQGNTTWSFGRSFLRQDSMSSIGRRNSSQVSLESTCSSMDSINLERAVSCDSVNSESSVALSDLEQPYTQITGYLCVGLQSDKYVMGIDLKIQIR